MKKLTLTILILCVCVFACNDVGKRSGLYTQKTTVAETTPEGTTTTTTTDIHVEAKQKSPKDVKEQLGLSIGPEGINAGGNSTWQNDIDGLTSNSWMFYGAGILLTIAAIVLASWLKQYMLGLSLGGAALVCFIAPTVIPILGIWVAALIVLSIILGIAYIVGKYVFGWELKTAGQKAFAKLRGEGKVAEAVAIRRATDPKFDKEYVKNKELNEGIVPNDGSPT